MDKKHRLDAPHNDSLESIEQVGDHSELSALYFNARTEWEGKEIISDEERHARNAKELLAITLSIRKWFAVIGLLTPLPFIILVCIVAFAVTTITTTDSARLALPLVIFLLGSWIAASLASMRKVFGLFYEHALRAAPVVLILLVLDGLAAQASFLLTRPFQVGNFFTNSLVVSGGTLVFSVGISGLLLLIWTSPRLNGNTRIGLIATIAGVLLITILLATLL